MKISVQCFLSRAVIFIYSLKCGWLHVILYFYLHMLYFTASSKSALDICV